MSETAVTSTSPSDGANSGAATDKTSDKVFNPEAFALNLARAMENTGRALSAYLQPREHGDRAPGELGEMIKSLYAVADYWMADQKRAADLQTKLGKSYLDLWQAR